MKLLVGLGNPGAKYRDTRHNVGFLAVDEIVRRWALKGPRQKFESLIYEGEIEGTRVLAIEPQTFMNNSGEAVGPAARFYKIAPADTVVLHDEIDLAQGKLRVKRGGGAAGHNGLRSIDAAIGQDYWRVRIGVGHPGTREQVLGWVLDDFPAADRVWLDRLLPAIADALPLLIEGQDSAFMSKAGGAVQKPAA